MKTTIKQNIQVIDFLMQWSGAGSVSKTKAKEWIKQNKIMCNGKTVQTFTLELKTGDEIEMVQATNSRKSAKFFPFPVLFEDRYLIAIEKPAGLLTSGEEGNTAFKMVSEVLKENSGGKERAEVVHRLDKEVSGVLLFAKSIEIQEYLRDNWDLNEKYYYALVEGHPKKPVDKIQTWLREKSQQKVVSGPRHPDAKLAITEYKTLELLDKYALLEVKLATGRKNQIRVHLSDIHCPIVGDWKYGANGEFNRRIRLHAFKLILVHPVTNEKIEIESPMPKSFLKVLPQDENYK